MVVLVQVSAGWEADLSLTSLRHTVLGIGVCASDASRGLLNSVNAFRGFLKSGWGY